MRFAIITDTHIRAPGGDLSSPFPVNDKANARAEYAVGMIAAARPDFTIHLGDVIHPLHHMPTAESATTEAQRILAPLQPNLYFVPGNHDIGDKPSPLMPAAPTDAQAIKNFESQLGPQYHTFSRGELQIFCINSSLINTASPAEQQQQDWLESELANSTAKLKLLFSHYPPFILDAAEPDHYDNYAEPGRSWLLDLAAKHNVDTIFSGHVHHFFYNRWQNTTLYCLPATSFIRQDYAELFPISPADEFGRDDTGKFGVTLVEIDDNKPRLTVLNTFGKQGQYTDNTPRLSTPTRMIVNLRHDWHTPQTLPYNGPMEEFSRKQARNDYPLLRLMQLGLHTLRLPGVDLLEPAARQRIEDWLALDHHIVPFCTADTATEVIGCCRQLQSGFNVEQITALEVLCSPQQNLSDSTKQMLSDYADVAIWLSRITSSADNPDPGKTFAHTVGCGAYVHQLPDLIDTATATNAKGVVLQLPWEAPLAETLQQAVDTVKPHDLSLIVSLSMRKSSPAEANFDDAAIAERIAEAMQLAADSDQIFVQLDNFEDIDRGYGPRHGLIDRLCNIRPAYISGIS